MFLRCRSASTKQQQKDTTYMWCTVDCSFTFYRLTIANGGHEIYIFTVDCSFTFYCDTHFLAQAHTLNNASSMVGDTSIYIFFNSKKTRGQRKENDDKYNEPARQYKNTRIKNSDHEIAFQAKRVHLVCTCTRVANIKKLNTLINLITIFFKKI